MWWSPPSSTLSIEQSIQVRTPSSTGAPDGAADQSTAANLSSPERPNTVLTSRCSWDSTFTQKKPAASISGQVRDDLPGQNRTSGGSSDSAANDWQAKPIGSPSVTVAMTVTPVQKCPSACRNARPSITSAAVTCIG